MSSTPVYRPAVRVVLCDERDRTLLMLYRGVSGTWFWVPPGGGVEAGEHHLDAVRRELAEEVGLDDVRIEPLGWRRRVAIPYSGGVYDQDERWFSVRCQAADVDAALADGARQVMLRDEGVHDVRWWTRDEIVAADDLNFAPADLATRLPGVLRGDPAVECDVV